MPEIKLKHVVSCSTEDSTHKADNLLSSDTYRKWKSARPGEKQTSVILQFEKEEQVHSIDVGNEGSAFIEVLVGHSTSVRDQDFQVLLVTSSFMSPTESRSGTNLNRVRFFGPQQLVKATAQEKWDRVKIVCSQPYSKNIAYGVSFIKFHSPPDGSEPPAATPPKLTKLGQFRVKDESPASGSNLQPGSLFFNRDAPAKPSPALKVSPQSTKLSYAAAALQSEPSTQNPPTTSSPQAPVKRKFEFSKERQEAPPPPAKKPSPSVSPQTGSATPRTKPSSAHTTSPNPAKSRTEKKPEIKPKPKPRSVEAVPLNRIMEGVVFVLSGFQNPFRGELRDKALAMGGRYRPDWTPDSTHLICAFANTPKYGQVKAAGGLIVRKEWVLDCHKRKQKISYKRYLMDGAESSSEESGPEEEDGSDEEVEKKSPEKRPVTPRKSPVKSAVKEEEEYGGSTDGPDEEDEEEDGSGMDTEDELRRVEMKRKKKKGGEGGGVDGGEGERGAGRVERESDPYGGSTDENTDAEEEEDKPIPPLPDFLSGKRFYLYGTFPDNQRRLLQRYIIAFDGAMEEYMSEKVQFVITSQGWDDSFEDALMENGNLSFVKPTWIFAINDRQKLLPYQPYTVVP
ncbi:DNA repair protein XRCC1 isoform X1 [Astyanax mexicanus]|uniref:DNA repair protein XRCC1 isoform X1 n=1 Tax=Astyanax mexicanus TaxID=7994 RepID=UPI0020CAF840|nr:DNA repair protein XRCC1 isoform X1 [Astyanax mexicanus]XP_049321036.1 DNA repair protein XRCC1 isoform X1 [Astyanax mexicanus]XP_049321042.1 DNA repair protein XRCC1 isoform X1 [Astyanax mexicanus]XP_049321046.1 DNA repair protein XRCC1 isoform X1 [Astyanax mexicanus]